MKETLQQRLETCPLFAGITDLAFLTRCIQALLQRLDAGSRLDWQGGGYVAVIADGCVQAQDLTYHSGSVLGLEAALLGGLQSPVVAVRTSAVLLLPIKWLLHPCTSHCDEHRQLAENIAKVLARENRALKERQMFLLIRGTRARLCAYLNRQLTEAGKDTFSLPMSRQALAAYLNLSRPSLSRELCNLRDEGCLEFYRETVRILKPEVLVVHPVRNKNSLE